VRVLVREDLRAGLLRDRFVTAGVIAMLVSVQDLRDIPAGVFRRLQALLRIERVDRQRLARFAARDRDS
jgi:hypothetical protein